MPRLYIVFFLLLLHVPLSTMATVGFAEWEIKTPGGNFVSHVDPIKSKYGTCIRAKDNLQKSIIFVSYVRWWQYFKENIAGLAEDGYFLFNEKTKRVSRFPSKILLEEEIKRLQLGDPLSKRLLPADGWAEAWGRTLPDSTNSKKDDKQHREFCEQLEKQLGAATNADRDEYEIMCLER